MDVEFKLDGKEMRELLSSLSLTPVLIKKEAAKLLRGRFREFVMYARVHHYSGGPATGGIMGRVGMSVKPGRYGHLADAFSVRLKQAKTDSFGMYAKTMMNKSDHGFIAPMHEYGTGDRYRNRKASVERHGRDWASKGGRGWTGKLPARHPFQSAVDGFFSAHDLGRELDAAITKSIERAMKKRGATL